MVPFELMKTNSNAKPPCTQQKNKINNVDNNEYLGKYNHLFAYKN